MASENSVQVSFYGTCLSSGGSRFESNVSNGECKARSGCTYMYVQADVILQPPENKSIRSKSKVSLQTNGII